MSSLEGMLAALVGSLRGGSRWGTPPYPQGMRGMAIGAVAASLLGCQETTPLMETARMEALHSAPSLRKRPSPNPRGCRYEKYVDDCPLSAVYDPHCGCHYVSVVAEHGADGEVRSVWPELACKPWGWSAGGPRTRCSKNYVMVDQSVVDRVCSLSRLESVDSITCPHVF
jgi:hypothetical protein